MNKSSQINLQSNQNVNNDSWESEVPISRYPSVTTTLLRRDISSMPPSINNDVFKVSTNNSLTTDNDPWGLNTNNVSEVSQINSSNNTITISTNQLKRSNPVILPQKNKRISNSQSFHTNDGNDWMNEENCNQTNNTEPIIKVIRHTKSNFKSLDSININMSQPIAEIIKSRQINNNKENNHQTQSIVTSTQKSELLTLLTMNDNPDNDW